MRRLLLAFSVAAATFVPLAGRSIESPLETAAAAWDDGDYERALTLYLQILDSSDAEAAFETIALQTGELFQTIELTTDGEAPKFSPDGKHLSYETGDLLDRRTRLVATDNPAKTLAELQGFRGAFSLDGTKIAYLRVRPTPELQQAAAAVDSGAAAQRTQRLNAFNALVGVESQLVERDIATGAETPVETGRLRKSGLAYSSSGILLSASADDGVAQIYMVRAGEAAVPLTKDAGDKTILDVDRTGRVLTFSARSGGGRGRGGTPAADPDTAAAQPGAPPAAAPATGGGGRGMTRFGLIRLTNGAVVNLPASPALAADGSTVAYVARQGGEYRLMAAPVDDVERAAAVRSGTERLDAVALTDDGSSVVFQMMAKEDWEVYTVGRDGKGEARVTREIQHDVLPRFLGRDRLIAMIGEPRHRRSYVYDLASGRRTRLFHNNTVRTIAPEYAWVPSADGTKVLIVAERDGDTISPERGVYLVDTTRRVTREALRTRLRTSLEAERALREKTEKMFAPIAADVRKVVAQASVGRVFGYEKALFDFDSKHVTQPGNAKAIRYLADTYRSFGYEPELQEFEAAGRGGAPGRPTANVLATLKGTVNPELVYVVSSHFDSVATGPGADDDTSGTAALLETARVMAKHPQPATIVFASFTGEESGLLGSREYVRRAVAGKVRIVGALNNDMIGWANDHRLDNTIRYSNAGIRDVQHGAAMHFTDLITYDAVYYRSTDAAAYYEAFGDIVGGIGSYPVLGNPHYHQSHDLLDTINHQLVTEVAKTTAASLMLMASSPSRLTGLKVERSDGGAARVSWTAAPEKGVTGYLVTYGPPSNPAANQMRVTAPSATIPKATAGTMIAVKAVNARGLEGWDWARVTVR
jgi:hypothetical protein